MRSQQKDIVDRLGDLTRMLHGALANSKNKLDIDIEDFNQNHKKKKKEQKDLNKKAKSKRKLPKNQNSPTEEKNIFPISNSAIKIPDNKTEVDFQYLEDYEENSDQEQHISFKNYEDEIFIEYDEPIFQNEIEEEEEILDKDPSPIKNFALINIKSNAKSFVRLTYFRRWQRAFRAKQIQKSITNKMKKYKKADKKNDDDIYSPCYRPHVFKKIPLTEQKEAMNRLSSPRQHSSPRHLSSDNKKAPNQFVIPINSQYKPKTDEEKKKCSRRHYIRKIEYERDQKEIASKPLSQKEIMKTVDRLLKTKPQTEEEPVIPKSNISSKEQLQISLRLSVPKKEIEESEEKVKNKFLLPTKKEQLEICTRLAQPKPDFSPKPIRIKNTLTLAEQNEICERLSNTYSKKTAIRKKIEDHFNELKKNKKKDTNAENGKGKSKGKKKVKKHPRKKTKTNNTNADSVTLLPNNSLFLPAASPVPHQVQPASPMIFNTPKKVRFHGVSPSNKQNQSKVLSRLLSEALGQTPPEDDFIPSPRSDHVKSHHKRNRSQDLSSEDDQKQMQHDDIYYQSQNYHYKVNQEEIHYSLNDDEQKQNQKEETDDPSMNSDKQNQGKIFNSSNVLNQNLDISATNQIKETVHYPSSEDDNSEQNPNHGKIFDSYSINQPEEEINDQLSIEKVDGKQQNNEIIINANDVELTQNQKESDIKPSSENQTQNENSKEYHHQSINEQKQNQQSSELKSSDDEEQDQEEFHFESYENYQFLKILEEEEEERREQEQKGNISFEEEEEEELDLNINANSSDQLLSNDDSMHSSVKVKSRPNSGSSEEHQDLISRIETETLKEIKKIEISNSSKGKINNEEDEDEYEITINDNISGIQSPIQGLVSTSDLEVNLLTKSQDSLQESND